MTALFDVETQSDLEHEIWSSWVRFMFTTGTENPDGSYTLPAGRVERWKRQMNTLYTNLSEKEKDGDRRQVEKHIILMITGEIDRSEGTQL